MERSAARWTSLLVPAAGVAATAAVFGPFARLGIDPYHDGAMLKPALDVLAGQRLFRDTFSMYGVGIPYLQAATLWLFGPTLTVLRVTTVAAYAIAAGFLVDTWRRLMPPSLALLALAVWLLLPGFYDESVLMPWSSVWAIVFQAIAMDALVCVFMGSRPVVSGLIAGAACGGVFLCRQPVGIVTSTAVLAGLAIGCWRGEAVHRRRHSLLACVGGLGFVLVCAGLWLLGTSSFHEWYRQTIEWPRRWALIDRPGSMPTNFVHALVRWPELTLPWVALGAVALLAVRLLAGNWSWKWAVVGGGPIALAFLVYLVPPMQRVGAGAAWLIGIPGALLALTTAIAVSWIRGMGDTEDLAAFGASLIGLASWLQYYPIPCAHHTFWAVTPAVGIALYAMWRASGRHTKATAAVAILVMLPIAHDHARKGLAKLQLPWTQLHNTTALDGMWVTDAQVGDWQRLIAAVDAEVQRRHDVPMLIEGKNALYATLVTNRRNPGPFYVDWGIPGTDLTSARVRFASENRPLVFVEHAERPALAHALRAMGYREIWRAEGGRLLAPGPQAANSASVAPERTVAVTVLDPSTGDAHDRRP